MLIFLIMIGTLRQSPAHWNSTSGMPAMVQNFAFHKLLKLARGGVWSRRGPSFRRLHGIAKEKRKEKDFCQRKMCIRQHFFKSGNLSKGSVKVIELLLKNSLFGVGGDYFKNHALKTLKFCHCAQIVSDVTVGSLVKSAVVTIQGC